MLIHFKLILRETYMYIIGIGIIKLEMLNLQATIYSILVSVLFLHPNFTRKF